LIILPSQIFSLLNENLSNWHEFISDHQREINKLIDSFQQWDRVCEVANKINWLIFQNQAILSQISSNKNYVTRFFEELKNKISNQDYLSAIDWLYRLTTKHIRIIKSLENSQERLKSASLLAAIKYQSKSIIQQSQPPLQETILQNITVKIVGNILKIVKNLLKNLQQKTEQKITEVQNNQKNLEITLEYFYVISSTQRYLESQLLENKDTVNELIQDIENLREEIDITKKESKELDAILNIERDWWCNIWDNIPKDLKPNIDLFALDLLNTIPHYFDDWQEKLTEAQTWLNRYQKNIENWIQRLRYPSEEDLASFKKSYLDNVNIVGITCVKAGSKDFSEELTENVIVKISVGLFYDP
jgi:hypothetical protein